MEITMVPLRLAILFLTIFSLVNCANLGSVSVGAPALGARNYDKAIADATLAIQMGNLRPSAEAAAYYNRGTARLQKQQFDLAVMDFDRAIELDSSLDELYANRGTAYLLTKRYKQAIDNFGMAIEINQLPIYHVNRGVAYRHDGQFELAISDYSEVIRRNPNDADTYSARAVAYVSNGQLAQAASDV